MVLLLLSHWSYLSINSNLSPGEILVVPSGVIETDGDTKVTHCTWVFSRVDLSKPALCLPTKDKYVLPIVLVNTILTFSPL